jgi:hypothetical protein
VELTEYVSAFSVGQVSRPDFSFPYQVAHVFFFVERRPIRLGSRPGLQMATWRYAPAESKEWSSYLYGDPLGRASLEYRAAELLNSYGRIHNDLSLFYEDDDLVVYHLTKKSGGV